MSIFSSCLCSNAVPLMLDRIPPLSPPVLLQLFGVGGGEHNLLSSDALRRPRDTQAFLYKDLEPGTQLMFQSWSGSF